MNGIHNICGNANPEIRTIHILAEFQMNKSISKKNVKRKKKMTIIEKRRLVNGDCDRWIFVQLLYSMFVFMDDGASYFKVQACNDTVCGDMSEADAGKAEYIHTEEFSDIAQLISLMAGYPLLSVMAIMPIAVEALEWEGMTIPGPQDGDGTASISVTVALEIQSVHSATGWKYGS